MDDEGTHQATILTSLGFISHHKSTLHNTRCFSVQGRESTPRQMEQFCAPEDSQAPTYFAHLFPAAQGQLQGCQLGPGDLTDAKCPLKLEHLCSWYYYEYPSLNTLIILSNNFFEVREGVRLLMALKHFLNEAKFCSPF